MRLSQIRYFLEVCKCGNITKASKKLYVSQPSVTVAIKNLEEELGIKLFNRVKQRLFLTKEGEFFEKEAEKIIGELDSLTEVMKDFGKKRNSVKLGVPPMIGSFLFPEIFSGFQKLHPNITLDIKEFGAVELRSLLNSEALDVTIAIGERSQRENIYFSPILKTSFSLYGRKGHPLAEKEVVDLKDLEDEPFILLNKGFYINQFIMEEFKNNNIENPNIVLQTGQVQTIKRFIGEGIAVGFLIKNCVLESDGLEEIPFSKEIPITIGIEWKKGHYHCSDVASFIQYIDEKYNS